MTFYADVPRDLNAPQWPIRPGQAHPPLPLAMRPKVAARALGVSERTLWTLTKKGRIPHAKMGRMTVYPTAAIIRWLEEITNRPPAAGSDEVAG